MKSYPRLPPRLNKRIGRAMHDYSMFEDGDRVMVAVSGGVDSLTLACVLHGWQKKAPLGFELLFCHIDHGFWKNSAGAFRPEISIGEQLAGLDIHLQVFSERLTNGERSCFSCSTNRRNQLFDLAREFACNKIAFGHHKDDLIETFFLNLLYSGNISTMKPRQDLFNGRLCLLRPLAYLEKENIITLAGLFGLTAVKNLCPISSDSKREKIRSMITTLFRQEPKTKESVFAAMSNIRKDYLL